MTGFRKKFWRANWDKNLKWRMAILRRDKFTCKKCGLKSHDRKRLQVHHIKKRSHYPHLQYNLNNGISLCRECHALMKDDEENFERLCSLLIGNKNLIVEVGRLMYEDEQKEGPASTE